MHSPHSHACLIPVLTIFEVVGMNVSSSATHTALEKDFATSKPMVIWRKTYLSLTLCWEFPGIYKILLADASLGGWVFLLDVTGA